MNDSALHDPDAERTVIGGVILHPSSLVNVGKLDPQDFHDVRHSAIWAAIRSLDGDELPIDAITVGDRMVADGSFELLKNSGGREYFHEVTGAVVTIENIGYHSARLRRIARRRSWHRWVSKMAIDAADVGVDTDGFLDAVERGATKLIATADTAVGGPRGVYTVLRETMGEIEKRMARPGSSKVTGIPTGIEKWDSMTGGLQPSTLYIVAARPSMGKTALALNWIANGVEANEPNLFFSLEMNDHEQIERMLAKRARVSAQTLRRGHLDREEWIAVTRAASTMSVWALEIDDRCELDIGTIRTEARQWRARNAARFKGKIGCITIDYAGLIASSAGSGFVNDLNRARELGEMVRSLKFLAKELGVAVVLLCQLNRKLEERADKRPMKSDLKESGSIEEHADVITFIYRDVVYSKSKCEDPGAAELIIDKQRNGPTGTVECRWDEKIQSFHDGEAAPPKEKKAPTGARNWHPHAPDGED